jgi:trimeric autotransporter adhesin
MVRRLLSLSTFCLIALFTTVLSQAQTAQANPSTNTVPRLIRFAGTVHDLDGKPLSGIVGITFSLYAEQAGGAALWMETQNVQADSSGHYSVLLGSTKPDGLPAELFASEQARWIGVQIEQQAEQPRTLLVSAPYALKAGDSETLGGLPPSAYMLASSAAWNNTFSPNATSLNSSAAANSGTASPNASSDVTTTGGKANTIPMFTTATNIQNSLLTQTGTTAVNVGGTLKMPAIGTATAAKGFNSQAHDFMASVYNSTSKAAVAQTFQLQAEPVNNDKSTASGTLNLLYGSGSATPTETGLNFSNKGIITFASGQTFPGTGDGTITGVTAGTGLSGGGTSGTVTLKNTGVLSVTAGTGITSSGGQTPTIAINTSVVPELSAANKFTGNQSVVGNLSASGEIAAGGAPGGNVASGNVEVDASAVNTGAYGPGLTFAGGGETIASNRSSTGSNTFGLDLFTNYTSRLSVTNAGSVGIGTRTPGSWLEVDAQTNIVGITVNGGSSASGASQVGSTGLTANGGNGDLSTDANSNGGDGLVANGGESTSLPGIGVIANGGFGQDSGEGGSGLVATGQGEPNGDGSGGFFSGGNFGGGGDGLDATAGSGNAGTFTGDVSISGNLSKGGGSFKIDHPLDPANKYLYHSFVESPDMKNIYDGVVTLDANGEAMITMPEWFGALNRDFRYQLTCIGAFAPVYVAEELANNQFKIGGGHSGMKVSWQVTGIRQDAWANAHRIPVEEEKEARLRGYYIHPELYGAPADRQIEWARHPQMMKRMQQLRQQTKVQQKRLPVVKR